jgi:NADH-quinone oxidoreductase subunit C
VTQQADDLAALLKETLGERVQRYQSTGDEVAIEVPADSLLQIAATLRDEPRLKFEQLIDVAGLDYLGYGTSEWQTNIASVTGFSRGVSRGSPADAVPGRRFAVAYQLLSVTHNRRLRMRVWCQGDEDPAVDSLCGVWASANWFEREAFDLFGILFRDHPDLRRLLTDYGFIGHPFRKDFPLIGNVEVRYDASQQRVVYEPVTIEPRILVPKVIRHDNRYEAALKDAPATGAKP